MPPMQCPDNNEQCPTPVFPDARCDLGVPFHSTPGNLTGCAIGCFPCPDNDSPGFQHVLLNGPRWLRPDAETTQNARDAEGFLTPLESNRPQRVPRRMVYRLAPCWDDESNECYDLDYCNCYPGSKGAIGGDNGICCFDGECVDFGDIIPGATYDDFFFRGYSHQDSDIWCRSITDHDDHIVMLDAGRNLQAMFGRTWPCAPNPMIPCYGSTPGIASCEGSAANPPTPPPGGLGPNVYYIGESPERHVFDEVHLPERTFRLLAEPGMADRDAAMLDARNAILDYVRDNALPGAQIGVMFDRLDYQVPVAGAAGGNNAALDLWFRGWNVQEATGNCMDAPEVINWTRCRLAGGGPDVNVSIVIVDVNMQLSLVPMRMKPDHTDATKVQVWPSCRFRIRVTATARVNNVDDFNVENFPDGCTSLPDTPGDAIIYIDDQGRPVDVPTFTEWKGYLGAFSVPTWHNVHHDAGFYPEPVQDECLGGGSTPNRCLLLAANLTGIEIPGWPTHATTSPDKPNLKYGGRVQLCFDLSSFCAGWGACQ